MTERTSIFRHLLMGASLAAAALSHGGGPVQSLESIREAAEEHLRGAIPERGEVVVTAGTLDPRLRLARCPAALRASSSQAANWNGKVTVAVSCEAGAKWAVYVPVSVESRLEVLVLRQAVARGARLTAADVAKQTQTVSGSSKSYVTDVAALEGRTLKRSLAAGVALTADLLEEEVLVRRGQRVTLLARVGGIEVRAAGQALSDGRARERVRVQNAGSLRVVEGLVESADVIRISP